MVLPLRHRCLIALLILAVVPVQGAQTPDEVKARLEAVQKEIRGLRQTIDRSQGEVGGLVEELRLAEEEAVRASTRLAATRRDIADLQGRLGELESRRRQESDAIAGERALLATTVRSAWQLGRQDRLRLLLNLQDPAAVGRMIAWQDRLNATRIARIAAVERAVAALVETEHEINGQLAALAAVQERQVTEVAALEEKRRERSKILAALRDEIARSQGAIAALEGDQKRLEALLRSLDRALSDIPATAPTDSPFASRRGKMPWPVAGTVQAGFGAARAAGGGLTWTGTLIAAPADQPVRVVHHGRIVFADWMRGLGLLVIVDHGSGYLSLYGHLGGTSRTVGEWVQAGDPIGTTGDTGGQAASGLYFEIRHKGKPQNPVLWCSGRAPPRG